MLIMDVVKKKFDEKSLKINFDEMLYKGAVIG